VLQAAAQTYQSGYLSDLIR